MILGTLSNEDKRHDNNEYDSVYRYTGSRPWFTGSKWRENQNLMVKVILKMHKVLSLTLKGLPFIDSRNVY